MIKHATVTAPEMIGLLVWWIVGLAAPVILVRRWRRRRRAAGRLREQAGRTAVEQPAARPAPPPSAATTSETRASTEPRLLVPRLPSDALAPLCRFVDFQSRLEPAASELGGRAQRVEQISCRARRLAAVVIAGDMQRVLSILETHIGATLALLRPGLRMVGTVGTDAADLCVIAGFAR